MKKLLIIPVAIVALMLVSFSYRAGNWVSLTRNEGHFSISFPGKPEESAEMDKTEKGIEFKVNTASYSPDDSHVFMLGWIDMTNIYPTGKTMKELLEDSRDGAAASMKATKVETITTNLTGQPYIEFIFGDDQFIGKDRIYVINKFQYSVITIFSKADGIPADADKFIASFKYLP